MESNTFIGLDVHKASISVAVARGERGGEVGPPPLKWSAVMFRKRRIENDSVAQFG